MLFGDPGTEATIEIHANGFQNQKHEGLRFLAMTVIPETAEISLTTDTSTAMPCPGLRRRWGRAVLHPYAHEYKEHEGMSVPDLCKAIGEPTNKDLGFGSSVTCEELACQELSSAMLEDSGAEKQKLLAAHVAALAGIDVVISDISQEQVDKAMATIDRNLERQVQRDRINSAIKQDALDRLSGSTDYSALSDCDIVIEAATENESVKREIYKAMIPSLRPDTIIASNTSSI